MAKLEFSTLRFKERKEDDPIVVRFLRLFEFKLDREDLKAIGEFEINENSIDFKDIRQEQAEKKFNFLLQKGFQTLRNTLTGKLAIYIHRNSNIPLIGTTYFGFVDRGTNIIEVRAITGCNIDCMYCSVDEKKRSVDFIVEKDYLVEEFKRLVEFKECDDIEAHINPQGEPFLYEDLIPLIKDLKKIEQVKRISINTNATLLTEEKIDMVVKAGLTQINFSFNTFKKELAKKLGGASVDVDRIKKVIEYASKKMDINLSPIFLYGYTDKEIPGLIEFAKELQKKTEYKVRMGIQNFILYKYSKKPIKEIGWDEFYRYIRKLEEEHGFPLSPDFGIKKTKELPLPFKKGEVIKARVALPGRFENEKIVIARERCIAIKNCQKEGMINIKIIKNRDNIFMGTLL